MTKRPPGPAGLRHGPGDAGGVAVAPGRGGPARRQFLQQGRGGLRQQCRGCLGFARLRKSQHRGQAVGAGRAEAGRPHEGIELQHVEGGKGIAAQAPRQPRSMADQRRFACRARSGRLGVGKAQDFSVPVDPDHAARCAPSRTGAAGRRSGAGAGAESVFVWGGTEGEPMRRTIAAAGRRRHAACGLCRLLAPRSWGPALWRRFSVLGLTTMPCGGACAMLAPW